MKIHVPKIVKPTVVQGWVSQKGGAQTITTSTDTAVDWDTVVEDDYGFFNLGADATIATIPAGIERVTIIGQVRWASNATGRRQIEIWKGGAVMSPNPVETIIATGNNHVLIVQLHHFPVVEGDTFSINCWHNRGSDTTISGGGNPAWNYFKVIASQFSTGD